MRSPWRGPYSPKFTSEEREAIREVLHAWGFAPTRVDRMLRSQFYETDEYLAAVVWWSRGHERWPDDSDWQDRLLSRLDPEGGRITRRRFAATRHDVTVTWPPVELSRSGISWLQEFLLRRYPTEWFVREQLGAKLVIGIENMTVRRDAIARYGIDNLIRDGGGQIIQRDDFGILWALPTDNRFDARTLYVEVVNTTANEDGTHDHYFLRVPPQIGSARSAVVWTFGIDPEMAGHFRFTAQS